MKKKKLSQAHEDFMLSCTNALNHSPDEMEAVGISIAAKLRRMDDFQRILAENLVNKILMKGLLKELTRETDIVEPVYNSIVLNVPSTSNDTC